MRPSVKQDQHVYYPDVMLACRWEQIGEGFMINPKLIVEGLSPSAAGVDRCERRLNSKWISAPEAYAAIAHNSTEVALYYRATDW